MQKTIVHSNKIIHPKTNEYRLTKRNCWKIVTIKALLHTLNEKRNNKKNRYNN